MTMDNRYSRAMSQFYSNTPKEVFVRLATGDNKIQEEILFSGAIQAMGHHGYPLSDFSGRGVQVVLELGKGRIENTVGMEYHWIQLRHRASGPIADSREFIFGAGMDLYNAWHHRLYMNPAKVSEYGLNFEAFQERVCAHVATYFVKAKPLVNFENACDGLVKVRMI